VAKRIEKLLDALDERLAKGEISEETYKELKAKYTARLEKTARKKVVKKEPLVKSKITTGLPTGIKCDTVAEL